MKRKLLPVLWALILLAGVFGCSAARNQSPEDLNTPGISADAAPAPSPEADAGSAPESALTPGGGAPDEHGSYDQKDDVALFICTFGRLPGNYITKAEARSLGWEGGSLEPYAPGKCIGGDRFGNYEGLLPEGGDYKECDIDTLGKSSRGAKRIVFSSEGDVYYTDDHYESFTRLFPGD